MYFVSLVGLCWQVEPSQLGTGTRLVCPPRLGLLLKILVKAGGERGSRAAPEVMALHRIACISWFLHCAEAGVAFCRAYPCTCTGLGVFMLFGCCLSVMGLWSSCVSSSYW